MRRISLPRAPRVLVFSMILFAVCIGFFEGKINESDLLGCLLVWCFLSAWAIFLFWIGARPFFSKRAEYPALRMPCAVARVALVYAIIQVPIWGLMTWRFPPDGFTSFQVAVACAGGVFGFFGPASPLLVVFAMRIKQSRGPR